MTIKTNASAKKLKSLDAEQVWTQHIIAVILLLCLFSASCMSLTYSNGTIWNCWKHTGDKIRAIDEFGLIY